MQTLSLPAGSTYTIQYVTGGININYGNGEHLFLPDGACYKPKESGHGFNYWLDSSDVQHDKLSLLVRTPDDNCEEPELRALFARNTRIDHLRFIVSVGSLWRVTFASKEDKQEAFDHLNGTLGLQLMI